jgi:uncharacterized membrane protein YqjE
VIRTFSDLLALISLICVTGIVVMLFFVPIPKENKQLIDTVVPILVTAGAVGIWNFYFGSSKQSSVKNETIKNLSENKIP